MKQLNENDSGMSPDVLDSIVVFPKKNGFMKTMFSAFDMTGKLLSNQKHVILKKYNFYSLYSMNRKSRLQLSDIVMHIYTYFF